MEPLLDHPYSTGRSMCMPIHRTSRGFSPWNLQPIVASRGIKPATNCQPWHASLCPRVWGIRAAHFSHGAHFAIGAMPGGRKAAVPSVECGALPSLYVPRPLA